MNTLIVTMNSKTDTFDRMRRTIHAVLMTLTLVGLTSCLKTVTNNNSTNPAGISFVNLAINGPSFNVSVDGTKEGSAQTFPYAGYAQNTDTSISYTSIFAGIHSIAFTDSAGNILVSGETQFSKNEKYSIYLYDTLTTQGLQAVQLLDSWDSIPRGYSLFRFLNFSPTATNLTVWLPIAVDSNAFLSQAYIGATNSSTATLSTYIKIVPGTYTFTYSMGSTRASAFDSLSVTLLSGKAYTMFVTGLKDSTGSKAFKKNVIHMN